MIWNCRGVLNTNFLLVFNDLKQCYKPKIIIIMTETKLKKDKEHEIIPKLGFLHHTSVPFEGLLGGILVLWNVDIHLEVLEATRQEVYLKVQITDEELLKIPIHSYLQRREWISQHSSGECSCKYNPRSDST